MLSCNSLVKAQGEGIVNTPETNVLYRVYPNKVKFGMIDGSSDYLIKADGANMKADSALISYYLNNELIEEYDHYYIVEPNTSGQYVYFYFVDPETKDTIGRHVFRIFNLPVPQIYVTDGLFWRAPTIERLKEKHLLTVRYPIYLNTQMTVVSWELYRDGDLAMMQGEGQTLTAEALAYLDSLKSGDTLIIKVKYHAETMKYFAFLDTQIEVE